MCIYIKCIKNDIDKIFIKYKINKIYKIVIFFYIVYIDIDNLFQC